MKRGLEYLGAVVEELRQCGVKAGEKVAKKKAKKGKKMEKLEVIESEDESEMSMKESSMSSTKKVESKKEEEEEELSLHQEMEVVPDDPKNEDELVEVVEIKTDEQIQPTEAPPQPEPQEPIALPALSTPKKSPSKTPRKGLSSPDLLRTPIKDSQSDSYFDEPEY